MNPSSRTIRSFFDMNRTTEPHAAECRQNASLFRPADASRSLVASKTEMLRTTFLTVSLPRSETASETDLISRLNAKNAELASFRSFIVIDGSAPMTFASSSASTWGSSQSCSTCA